MAPSWLLFNPDQTEGKLYVEIVMRDFIESQPKTLGEADQFCEEIFPIVDQIQELCLNKGFKQVCTTNFEGVRLQNIRPHVLIKIIWNVYNHTKNCILLEGCEISHSDSFLGTLVNSVKSLLPPFMRDMVKVTSIDDQKYDEDVVE
jgi:hypothetical protein